MRAGETGKTLQGRQLLQLNIVHFSKKKKKKRFLVTEKNSGQTLNT